MKTYSIGHSLFGLTHYPSVDNEWPIRVKFAETAKRGYTHFEGDFGSCDRRSVRELAAEYALELGYIRFGVRSAEAMKRLLAEADEVGATYLVVIAGDSYSEAAESVQLIGECMQLAQAAGLPFYLESHRDSATQDLRRCAEIVRQLPGLRWIADLSHLLVASEITEDLYDLYCPRLQPILAHACGFHGRISNGQQIQIGIDNIDNPFIRKFADFWVEGLKHWKAGDHAEPFRFTVELGPPPYALTHPAPHENKEVYDRVEQGELLASLFSRCWEKVFGHTQQS